MKIYYFRQPNPKVEYYEFYSNNKLSREGEKLETTSDNYSTMVWAVKHFNNIES